METINPCSQFLVWFESMRLKIRHLYWIPTGPSFAVCIIVSRNNYDFKYLLGKLCCKVTENLRDLPWLVMMLNDVMKRMNLCKWFSCSMALTTSYWTSPTEIYPLPPGRTHGITQNKMESPNTKWNRPYPNRIAHNQMESPITKRNRP